MRASNFAVLIATPAILGVGAIVWLTFFDGAHTFDRKLSQEQRHAEIVGAKELPKAPMKIVLANRRASPVAIDRAEADGSDVWFYWSNRSRSPVCYVEFTWKATAPDGTVVARDRTFLTTASVDPGERSEAHISVPADPRAVTLTLSLKASTDICN